MFWRNRVTKYSFQYNRRDKRRNYRYYLETEDKLSVSINGKFFQADNFSAGGMAFCGGFCREGDRYSFHIKAFYDMEFDISGTMEILSSNENICRAKFIDLSESDEERLHKLVFKMQLRSIRVKRQSIL